MKLHVVVYYHQPVFLHAVIRNIGKDGLLLDTGRFELPTGGLIELASKPSRNRNYQPFHLRALIIHACKGKAGLWVINDSNVISGIYEALVRDIDHCYQTPDTRALNRQ